MYMFQKYFEPKKTPAKAYTLDCIYDLDLQGKITL